ncbi:MAG: sel1 repeat family protein [Gammaproteobacteria bacterium]|nr:sel1 repeat family protein [Gammaproteobacteria bacterium]MDH5240166.1 sel1 repeat family protein [Gammaproteobacteria bacterium]MDH5261302.1 sel1 repeat family protein [Gammaproteobacteria bacterium]MDH5583394.1 sel1 repeat family protein [Gammaproteobacteria bacterium]
MRYTHAMLAAALILFAPLAFGGDYQKGLNAYNSSDYATALAEWQPLAEAGDAGGQFGLGMMYGNGFGVDMDDAQAIKWYSLAAEQGHAQAQCNLAVMHQNGWGVPQSDAEAVRLYTLSAEQGIVEAMMALGRFYAMDFAPDYDPVQAYKWYSLAQLMGDLEAGPKGDELAADLSAEQVAQANAQVDQWSDKNARLIASKQ